MRIGLLAALRRADDGSLRAAMPLAGRSVIAWQMALLQSLGVERVLCLTETAGADIVALQHALEAQKMQIETLQGFAALPALVRAEDDLVIIADGLVPEPAVVHSLLGGGEGGVQRAVASIPRDHPLAVAHPEDFERIDALHHWAGVLAMRGAPVQQLADFPADADAISVLLRLALQAGTPVRALALGEVVPENWLLAQGAEALAVHQNALIAAAAPPADWRAPGKAAAAAVVRVLAMRGLAQGPLIAGSAALVLLLTGVMAAAFGFVATGLSLTGLGAFCVQVSGGFASLAARLRREGAGSGAVLAALRDGLAAFTLWFALAPFPDWQPLAVLGPVVIALAALVSRSGNNALAVAAGDRTVLLIILAVAASFALLPEALACLALGLCAALLLRRDKE